MALGRALGADHAERDLRHADLQQLDVGLAIAGDYFVVTATAPPIPSEIYKRHHDELDAAWAAHVRTRHPGAPEPTTEDA